MKVHLLSAEQKELLIGKLINSVTYFNPTYSPEGFWFISIEEVEQYEGIEFNWIKNLPLVDYTPYHENIL